jgi:hypothetical protein
MARRWQDYFLVRTSANVVVAMIVTVFDADGGGGIV